MTKKEIVRIIAERAELTQLKTKEIVQWTFDAIIDTLIKDGRIELRNFGVFEVKRRKARRARNPRTNDRVFVPEKNVVTFQPGKEMEERVRVESKAYEPKKKKAKAKPKKGKSGKTKGTDKPAKPAKPTIPPPAEPMTPLEKKTLPMTPPEPPPAPMDIPPSDHEGTDTPPTAAAG